MEIRITMGIREYGSYFYISWFEGGKVKQSAYIWGDWAFNFVEKFMNKYGELVYWEFFKVSFEVDDEHAKKFLNIINNLSSHNWRKYKKLAENIDDFDKVYDDIMLDIISEKL